MSLSPRVLVYEDRPHKLEDLLETLQCLGLELDLSGAGTREEYRHQLEASPGLVLAVGSTVPSDPLWPLRVLRERGLDAPLILLTASLGEAQAAAALKLGVYDWLPSTDLPRLQRTVRRALEYRQLARENRRLAEGLGCIASHARSFLWYAHVWEENGKGLRWRVEIPDQVAARRALDIVPRPGQPFEEAWYESILPEDQAAAEAAAEKALRSGWPGYTAEVRYRRASGDLGWWCQQVTIERVQPGRWRLLGIGTEVTELKRSEEALLRSKEVFRATINTAVDGIVTIDEQGRILQFNKAAERIFGYAADEVLGRSISLLMPSPYREEHDAYLQRYLNTGQASIIGIGREVVGQRKDGTAFPMDLAVSDLLLDGHHWFTGIIRDISERKRTEAALREREAQLGAVFESSLDAILILDDRAVVRDANPAASVLFDRPRDQIIGAALRDLLDPTRQQPLEEAGERFLREGFLTGVSCVRRPDGTTRNVDYAARARFLPGRHLAVFRDITDRQQLEDQLRQSQKMEAIGRLAGGVAHDFNNLLTAITGYSTLMLTLLDPQAPLHKHAREIQKAADRAASLTSQLLAFSRKQVLQPRVLDLNEVVAGVERMLRRLIGEDIDLVTRTDPHLGKVKADPGQMEQVLMNLAVNARDAMPAGGKLSIETANVRLDETYARGHLATAPGDYVMLAVGDTGSGMDAETRSRIFEPFFTTKEPGKGTGLGLSTVYGIVQQSGGTIWVYSEPDRGTIFKIYLPREWSAGEAPGVEEAAEAPAPGKETVLVVEDEEMVRSLVREILGSHGYEVLEARDSADALRICEQHPAPIHLMLTDVIMPETGGHELAQRAAALRPQMRVLYVSGYTSHAIVHHGVLEPGIDFLQKPFTPNALALKVREVLDRPRDPS